MSTHTPYNPGIHPRMTKPMRRLSKLSRQVRKLVRGRQLLSSAIAANEDPCLSFLEESIRTSSSSSSEELQGSQQEEFRGPCCSTPPPRMMSFPIMFDDDDDGTKDCAMECMICLEGVDGADEKNVCPSHDVLPCGHTFHRCCVNTWRYKHQTCPTCRLDLEFVEMHC
jgi:hypothetical protein